MKIKLSRDIYNEAIDVIMQLEEPFENYDFLLCVLELEDAHGKISAEIINTELLDRDEDDIIGYRILSHLQKLKKIESNYKYKLTSKGLQFLELLKIAQTTPIKIGKIAKPIMDILIRKKIFEEINNSFFQRCQRSLDFNNLIKLILMIQDIDQKKVIGNEYDEILLMMEREVYLAKSDIKYVVSESGKRDLKDRTLRLPREIEATIYVTGDSLFEYNPILSYEYTTFYDSAERFPVPLVLKPLLELIKQSPQVSLLPGKLFKEIVIHKIEPEMVKSKKKKNFSVEIEISDNKDPVLRVKSENRSDSKQDKYPLNVSFNEILYIVVDSYPYEITKITENNYAILLSYDDITKENWINKEKMDLSLKNKISLQKYGEYNVVITDLIILPKTENDAMLWIKERIIGQINKYISEFEYNKLLHETSMFLSSRFPNPTALLPYPLFLQELCMNKTDYPEEYWYVQAPKCLTFERDS